MLKTVLLAAFTTFSVFAKAQNDTTAKPGPPGFFSSSLQLTLGQNFPVGNYGGKNIPFQQGFAVSPGLVNLSAKYDQLIGKNWGFTIGAQFIRNQFDYFAFRDAYLKRVGDTLSCDFMYEHIAIGAGATYFIKAGDFLFSGGMTMGGLYTLEAKKSDGGVWLDVDKGNTTGTYNGGLMHVGKSIRPMVITEFDVKYSIGYDAYLVFALTHTLSSYKLNITERDGIYYNSPQHPFLKKEMPINNIACCIGICTTF